LSPGLDSSLLVQLATRSGIASSKTEDWRIVMTLHSYTCAEILKLLTVRFKSFLDEFQRFRCSD